MGTRYQTPSRIAEEVVRSAQRALTSQSSSTTVGPFIDVPFSGAQIAAYRCVEGGTKGIRYEVVCSDGTFTNGLTFRDAQCKVDRLIDGDAGHASTKSESTVKDRLTLMETTLLGLDDGTTTAAFNECVDFGKYVELFDEEHQEHIAHEKQLRVERPMLEHMRRSSDTHLGGRVRYGRR